MSCLVITESNFELEVLKSSKPVLLDFWAPWCGPCKAISPTVEAVADELAGQLVVGKVNVDDNPQLAAQYGIMSIPSLLLFHEGNVKEQIMGVTTKEKILHKIKPYL